MGYRRHNDFTSPTDNMSYGNSGKIWRKSGLCRQTVDDIHQRRLSSVERTRRLLTRTGLSSVEWVLRYLRRNHLDSVDHKMSLTA